ncbi:SDR family oxidoreductase [Bacillus sinesaloumensis]|uniref:SDR family oxidoreductase n=1 Tax=Litchfieldia sinesaloumensis TaxID=1926280 RepID=UPI00098890CB|nr:SDR family oxidoreductase [Bacillus sinesaloumensis]
MEKPIVLITGASSGFGLLTAVEYVKKGYFVVATMRDLQKRLHVLQELNDRTLEDNFLFCKLDVTNAKSLTELHDTLQNLGRVDILLNNAGFAMGGFAEEITIEEYKSQFETNFFGLIEATRLVLPHMRRRGSGTIINISSISGQIGFPGLSPYVASKYALEGWSESLQLEVRPFGINVALIEPGSYQTNIWSSGKKIAKRSILTTSPYYEMMKKIEKRLEKGQSTYGDPLEVARFIVKLTEKPSLPKLRYPVGKNTRISIFLKTVLPWRLWERIVFRMLGVTRR